MTSAIDLRGQVALVTGGGSGIGAGIASALAEAGAHAVVVGRRTDRLERTCEAIAEAGGQASPLRWDLGRGDGADELLAAAVARAGKVDLLVHAAGIQHRAPSLELGLEQWDAVVDLHLRAAFALSQALGRHLVDRAAPGSVLYVGSLTSQRVGIPGAAAYGAAKSGLLGLTRTLAVEWAEHRIRVNALLVGFVETEMTREVDGTPARVRLTSRIPLGRHGAPAEVGAVAAFLASEHARYVTGEALTVDGGWSAA